MRDYHDALRAERGGFDVPHGGAGIYFTRLTADEADVAAKARHEKSTREVLADQVRPADVNGRA